MAAALRPRFLGKTERGNRAGEGGWPPTEWLLIAPALAGPSVRLFLRSGDYPLERERPSFRVSQHGVRGSGLIRTGSILTPTPEILRFVRNSSCVGVRCLPLPDSIAAPVPAVHGRVCGTAISSVIKLDLTGGREQLRVFGHAPRSARLQGTDGRSNSTCLGDRVRAIHHPAHLSTLWGVNGIT